MPFQGRDAESCSGTAGQQSVDLPHRVGDRGRKHRTVLLGRVGLQCPGEGRLGTCKGCMQKLTFSCGELGTGMGTGDSGDQE